MHNFQSYLRNIRKSKSIRQDTIADAIDLSIDTIQNIENANVNNLLQTSNTLLKNQIRKYCEYIDVHEKKIISILNKLDILYYKKSRYGKLKPFDYLNRVLIIGFIIAITTLCFQIFHKNIYNTTLRSSKSSIIYTPINYPIDRTSNTNLDVIVTDDLFGDLSDTVK